MAFTKTKTLKRSLASVRRFGSRYSVQIAGQRMTAVTRQDAKRRAYKHARTLRLRAI
jgi:hypothetical protein